MLHWDIKEKQAVYYAARNNEKTLLHGLCTKSKNLQLCLGVSASDVATCRVNSNSVITQIPASLRTP